MPQKKITISVPDDILISLNESAEELSMDMKLYSAIWLYQKGKLTIGKAARLAGMHRYDFETLLSDNNIPISLLSEKDIEHDVKKLEDSLT